MKFGDGDGGWSLQVCLRLCFFDFYVLSGEFSHIVWYMKGVSSLTTREIEENFCSLFSSSSTSCIKATFHLFFVNNFFLRERVFIEGECCAGKVDEFGLVSFFIVFWMEEERGKNCFEF